MRKIGRGSRKKQDKLQPSGRRLDEPRRPKHCRYWLDLDSVRSGSLWHAVGNGRPEFIGEWNVSQDEAVSDSLAAGVLVGALSAAARNHQQISLAEKD